VRLREVAKIVDDAENNRLSGLGRMPPPRSARRLPPRTGDSLGAARRQSAAVILNIQRQPGANVIETVDRIKALLPSCRPRCPLRWMWRS
jgi:multidrug efflux pump